MEDGFDVEFAGGEEDVFFCYGGHWIGMILLCIFVFEWLCQVIDWKKIENQLKIT